MSLKKRPTRRDFLKTTGAAFGVPYIITSAALGNSERPPASDRIVIGGIGIGNMGRGDQGAFLGRKDVQYVAMSDVREEVREKSKANVDKHYGSSDCQAYNDFRELLARPDIDAVHIATPDHWHAIMVIEACRNGKDVYCQKPETLTLREGPLMIAAARRYGRVVSGGSQRVLEDYRKYVDPAGLYLSYRCPNGLMLYHNRPQTENLAIEGTPDQPLPPKPVPGYQGEGGIYGDFIHCVKTREKPFRDIELAVNSSAVSHLGNIAYALKRSLKWDSSLQEFPGDEEANRLTDRARREPWQL